jgi:glycosyltransferase involved in cell wall biosynthesis
MNIDFIIPVYNEEKNINNLICEIRRHSQGRIIVVDDFSDDNTYLRISEDYNIIKIRNIMNYGKGYSIKKGLYYADGDFVALIDGDMRGIIKHVSNSLEVISEYDCVIFSPPIKNGGIGILRRFAHDVVFRETGLSIPWCLSGMRIIKKGIIENIKDKLDDRFAFEVSMTIELIKNNYKVNNIQVDFEHRLTGRDIKGYYHRGKQFEDIYKYYHRLRK